MSNYLTCRIASEWYGIPIRNVIEVLHIVALNQVPGESVFGVMTLREQVIKVTDLRTLFGVPDPEYDMETPIIALTSKGLELGVIVDDADTVLDIADDQLVSYNDRAINYVAKLEGRLLFILDIEQLFDYFRRQAGDNGAAGTQL